MSQFHKVLIRASIALALSLLALGIAIATYVHNGRVVRTVVASPSSSPTPVWREFDGGVFSPRNGEVPIVQVLPPTCEPCDYVNLEPATPSLYECSSTVSLKDCQEKTRVRIAAKKAAKCKEFSLKNESRSPDELVGKTLFVRLQDGTTESRIISKNTRDVATACLPD